MVNSCKERVNSNSETLSIFSRNVRINFRNHCSLSMTGIRWHMGPYSGERDWNTLGAAMEKYPLVMALFEADMEATHILESGIPQQRNF